MIFQQFNNDKIIELFDVHKLYVFKSQPILYAGTHTHSTIRAIDLIKSNSTKRKILKHGLLQNTVVQYARRITTHREIKNIALSIIIRIGGR